MFKMRKEYMGKNQAEDTKIRSFSHEELLIHHSELLCVNCMMTAENSE